MNSDNKKSLLGDYQSAQKVRRSETETPPNDSSDGSPPKKIFDSEVRRALFSRQGPTTPSIINREELVVKEYESKYKCR